MIRCFDCVEQSGLSKVLTGVEDQGVELFHEICMCVGGSVNLCEIGLTTISKLNV